MCHQTNLRFYDDVAYEKQYKGLILDGYEGCSLLHHTVACLLLCVPGVTISVKHSPDTAEPQLSVLHEA